MAVVINIAENVRITDTNASPRGGAGIAVVDRATIIPTGTAAGQADLATVVDLSVTGSGNLDWDARAAAQLSSQAACNGAELAYLRIEWPAAADGNLTVKVAASNGLDILNGSTDGLVLRAGSIVTLDFLQSVGPAMDASNKAINFANAGATTNTARITAAFRSA